MKTASLSVYSLRKDPLSNPNRGSDGKPKYHQINGKTYVHYSPQSQRRNMIDNNINLCNFNQTRLPLESLKEEGIQPELVDFVKNVLLGSSKDNVMKSSLNLAKNLKNTVFQELLNTTEWKEWIKNKAETKVEEKVKKKTKDKPVVSKDDEALSKKVLELLSQNGFLKTEHEDVWPFGRMNTNKDNSYLKSLDYKYIKSPMISINNCEIIQDYFTAVDNLSEGGAAHIGEGDSGRALASERFMGGSWQLIFDEYMPQRYRNTTELKNYLRNFTEGATVAAPTGMTTNYPITASPVMSVAIIWKKPSNNRGLAFSKVNCDDEVETKCYTSFLREINRLISDNKSKIHSVCCYTSDASYLDENKHVEYYRFKNSPLVKMVVDSNEFYDIATKETVDFVLGE